MSRLSAEGGRRETRRLSAEGGRRTRIVKVLAALVFALHCGSSDEATYTPDTDARFVESVAGEYVGDGPTGTITIVLCEDEGPSGVCSSPAIGRVADCPGACHRIRGRGAGTRETLSTDGGGCDCPGARAELAIRGSIAEAGTETALSGALSMNTASGDPYAMPWRIFASTDADGDGAATVRGNMEVGRLVVTVRGATHPMTLAKTRGAGACL